MNELNCIIEVIPLVSIVCITYNQETYITHAIKGFLMQKTKFQFEIIIHDDASTDKTAEIIQLYQKKFPKLFKCIFQTVNQYSRKDGSLENIIFSAPRGKYIAFCEGDDFWTDPNKLQKQVDFLEANEKISFCFHNATSYNVDTKISEDFNGKLKTKLYNTNDLLLKRWFIPTASLLFRKEMLPKPFPEWYYKVYNGDYALELMLSTKGDFFCINEKMSIYRKNAINSLTLNGPDAIDIVEKKLFLLTEFKKYNLNKNKFAINFAIAKMRYDQLKVHLYEKFPFLVILKIRLLRKK